MGVLSSPTSSIAYASASCGSLLATYAMTQGQSGARSENGKGRGQCVTCPTILYIIFMVDVDQYCTSWIDRLFGGPSDLRVMDTQLRELSALLGGESASETALRALNLLSTREAPDIYVKHTRTGLRCRLRIAAVP